MRGAGSLSSPRGERQSKSPGSVGQLDRRKLVERKGTEGQRRNMGLGWAGRGWKCGLSPLVGWHVLGPCMSSWASFWDTPPNRAGRTGKVELEGGEGRSKWELLEFISSHYSRSGCSSQRGRGKALVLPGQHHPRRPRFSSQGSALAVLHALRRHSPVTISDSRACKELPPGPLSLFRP